jgi:hypothetical protein
MIAVIKCRERALSPVLESGEACLYIRRDVFPDKTFEEYAYVGPEQEVLALADRCKDVDIQKIDSLLHRGKSFEEALKELGA